MSILSSFIFYDISFLIIFAIFLLLFFYKNKKNVKTEGIMILYRTSLGVKLMDKVGKKYKGLLHGLGYVCILVGYILMAVILFLVGLIVYTYVKFPQISDIVKAPPVVPIFPYFTNVFGLESFFPTFYGVYFIVVIAITMFVHEFAHGIFMRLHDIKIKSTGLAFLLLIIPGAFVEQDEKSMNSKGKFAQMSVLSAGVFGNMLVAVLAYVLLVFFFSSLFVASGAVFNSYPTALLNGSEIQMINGIDVSGLGGDGILDVIEDNQIEDKPVGSFNLTEITYGDLIFYVPVENLKTAFEENGVVQAVYDSPTVKAGFPKLEFLESAAVIGINSVEINDYSSLESELLKYSPGDLVEIDVEFKGEVKSYELVLGENPSKEGVGFMGISFYQTQRGINGWLNFYKDEQTMYKPVGDNSLYVLIHDFLWWLALINLFVAMFNMLPVGILDGGRFFYLTVLGLTKSERVAKISFKLITYAILLAILSVFIIWIFT
jgi:membrane-associated protease RseP (regulator of RpoE activity)